MHHPKVLAHFEGGTSRLQAPADTLFGMAEVAAPVAAPARTKSLDIWAAAALAATWIGDGVRDYLIAKGIEGAAAKAGAGEAAATETTTSIAQWLSGWLGQHWALLATVLIAVAWHLQSRKRREADWEQVRMTANAMISDLIARQHGVSVPPGPEKLAKCRSTMPYVDGEQRIGVAFEVCNSNPKPVDIHVRAAKILYGERVTPYANVELSARTIATGECAKVIVYFLTHKISADVMRGALQELDLEGLHVDVRIATEGGVRDGRVALPPYVAIGKRNGHWEVETPQKARANG